MSEQLKRKPDICIFFPVRAVGFKVTAHT